MECVRSDLPLRLVLEEDIIIYARIATADERKAARTTPLYTNGSEKSKDGNTRKAPTGGGEQLS